MSGLRDGSPRACHHGSVPALTRRDLLVRAAASGAALAGAGLGAGRSSARAAAPALPAPAASGIDHVVVVCMENRSFDHLLGWLPGADGKQAGLAYPDRSGKPVATYPLAPDWQGCGHADPDHSSAAGLRQVDGGKMDGFLRTSAAGDTFPVGYYTQADLPFLGQAAPAWTAFDRYFAASLGPTFPNRMYLHAGRTDRTRDAITISSLPTIWDRLKAARLSGRYYTGGLPYLALWGARYLPITKTFNAFLTDARKGTLPQVAYVDPPFTLEGLLGGSASSTGQDDHPHGDIRAGETWLNRVYEAVVRSPAWERTLLVITFDEWGGFFDHVPPEQAPDVGGPKPRGPRVPTLVVSPRARRGYVEHGTYDHASILALIEWRWGLKPLAPRDATARNLALALDWESAPDTTAPAFQVPVVGAGKACA